MFVLFKGGRLLFVFLSCFVLLGGVLFLCYAPLLVLVCGGLRFLYVCSVGTEGYADVLFCCVEVPLWEIVFGGFVLFLRVLCLCFCVAQGFWVLLLCVLIFGMGLVFCVV